jgi:hypothetical protein
MAKAKGGPALAGTCEWAAIWIPESAGQRPRSSKARSEPLTTRGSCRSEVRAGVREVANCDRSLEPGPWGSATAGLGQDQPGPDATIIYELLLR